MSRWVATMGRASHGRGCTAPAFHEMRAKPLFSARRLRHLPVSVANRCGGTGVLRAVRSAWPSAQPAGATVKRMADRVLGVDACRSGWVGVALEAGMVTFGNGSPIADAAADGAVRPSAEGRP
jgi:hypothetical protein